MAGRVSGFAVEASNLLRGSMVVYARPDDNGLNLKRSNYVVHFDNFVITAR